MPNHIHILFYMDSNAPALNKLISNGKRFLAYEIIKRLKQSNQHSLLFKLNQAVSELEKQRNNRKHKVFRTSFDAKACYSEEVINQKLDYMHHNPVKGKWNLSNSYLDYKHSSAGFYEKGDLGQYKNLVHYRDVFDYK